MQGWFEVKICPVNDPKTAATQECLDKHVLLRADGGGMRFPVIKGKYNAFFNYTVQLPPDLTCKQCVVQWKYRTGVIHLDLLRGRGGVCRAVEMPHI